MMRNSKKRADTRKKIFDFYAANMKSCDDQYALAEDENIDQLYQDVRDGHSKRSMLVRTSVVLLTANKYERNILHKRVYEATSKPIQRIEIELLTACQRYNKAFAYWFEWNGYSILNIHANVTGSYTIGGSADVIRWILHNEYLFPTAVISFGICFGTQESGSELGDVVISKKVYPYFIGAKVKGQDLTVVDDNAFRIDDDWANKIFNLRNNNKLNKFPSFSVHFANYITGEAVVNSRAFRDKFVHTTSQEIMAGDMEGYGLFKECNNSSYSIPCAILKSICDWGAEKNFDADNEEIQSQLAEAIGGSAGSGTYSKEHLKHRLKSLKDRLQAYSVSCAFDVLNVMLQQKTFTPSILEHTEEWIKQYNGVATTCKIIRDTILKVMKEHKLGFSVPDPFIHRCLIILEERGYICCDEQCKGESEFEDICIRPCKDASIDINYSKEG